MADVLDEIEALTELGPRAPGSDAERRAATHLAERLKGQQREVEIEAIEAWPAWPQALAVLAAASVVASVLSVSIPVAGAALALAAAFLTFLEAGLLVPAVRRLFGRRASQNVVSWGDRDKAGALVLVAHYDAGRRGLALGQGARSRLAALGSLVRRPIGTLEPLFWAQLAVLACCLLRLAGLSGVLLTVFQFVPTVALLVAVALLIDAAISPTASGHNDNASGASLAVQLAERYGAKLEHFDVHVLLTGSQKALGAGMRGFLKRHKRDPGPERTVFLNLDEVGSGTVRYTTREGSLVASKSHLQLVKLCEEIAEDEEGPRALVNRSASDGYLARAAGLPAITISCRGRTGAAAPRVDSDAVARAEAFCAELIERLDAELGPDLAGPVDETVLSEAEDQ